MEHLCFAGNKAVGRLLFVSSKTSSLWHRYHIIHNAFLQSKIPLTSIKNTCLSQPYHQLTSCALRSPTSAILTNKNRSHTTSLHRKSSSRSSLGMADCPPCGWTYGVGLTSCCAPEPPPPYCSSCVPQMPTLLPLPYTDGFSGQINNFWPCTSPSQSSLPVYAAPQEICTDPWCPESRRFPPTGAPLPNYPGPYSAPSTAAATVAPASANKGPPKIAGSSYLQPGGPYLTFQTPAAGIKLWESNNPSQFEFKVSTIETSTSVRELIKRLGGSKGHKITEAYERGGGVWHRGRSILYKAKEAKDSLAKAGWTERRGREAQPPLWLVLEKCDVAGGGGDDGDSD